MLVPFEIAPGVFSDDTAFARAGTWQASSNVRWRFGKPETIGGYADLLSGSALTGVCRNAHAWSVSAGLNFVAFGTHTALEILSGSSLYDITPSGLVDGSIDSSGGAPGWGSGAWGEGTWGSPASIWYARTWSFANYGDDLIANARGGTIYQWELDTGTEAAAVTNAPDTVTCCLVTPERQLLAFGCNEEVSGDFNHLCIRGSNIEDITDWTTAVDSNAFEQILPGGGRIVKAELIGSYVAVWTSEALFLGQFIGDPGQAYRFDLIAYHCGLIGPNALAIIDQTAIWLGTDHQFRIWNLGQAPATLPCPVHKEFFDNLVIAQADKIVATSISGFGEVWFFYPDARDGSEASRYIAYSYRESGDNPVWFGGLIGRTQAMDAGATTYPVMADVNGGAYFHEYGTNANGGDLDWFLESADTYLQEGGRELLVRRLIPDFESQEDDVSLTLNVKKYPQSDAMAKGPHTISPGAEKVDFRASGRLLSAYFEGTNYMRLGRPVFDVIPMGER